MARTVYRRVVLGLHPGALQRRTLRTAAEIARLLELEMLGIFIEDQTVLGASALSFTRELRLPGHAWQPLESHRVEDDLRAAAEQARVLLDQESAALGITCRFEVRRGDPATLVVATCELTDIVVLAEPAEEAERMTAAIGRERRAALASPAAILFLPSAALSPVGPVAVVAADESDPALELAARLASAARDKLLILAPSHGAALARAVAATGAMTVDQIDVMELGEMTRGSLRRALAARRERLLVMTRGAAGLPDEAPAALAKEREAPVLALVRALLRTA